MTIIIYYYHYYIVLMLPVPLPDTAVIGSGNVQPPTSDLYRIVVHIELGDVGGESLVVVLVQCKAAGHVDDVVVVAGHHTVAAQAGGEAGREQRPGGGLQHLNVVVKVLTARSSCHHHSAVTLTGRSECEITLVMATYQSDRVSIGPRPNHACSGDKSSSLPIHLPATSRHGASPLLATAYEDRVPHLERERDSDVAVSLSLTYSLML